MWLSSLSAAAALLAPSAASAISPPAPHALAAIPRAAPDAPSGGYAPSNVTCPKDGPRIRGGGTISSEEKDWLESRDKKTRKAISDFLDNVNIRDFDSGSFLDRDGAYPRIAISLSGGGYRALLNGAGFIKAADERTAGDGGIGGLLQSATYLSGLSGGSWLVSSIYGNNFTTVQDLQDDESLWQFQNSILTGPPSTRTIGILDTAKYWRNVYDEVEDKDDAGFETSLTDYWGRAVSYQLISDNDGGAGYTVSSIADGTHFKNGDSPFPIIVADGRNPGERVISLNSTVYEFNPYEMGSWDPTLHAFAPIEYLASDFDKGSVRKDGNCVRGFDQLSFVLGTSSSLFNTVLLQQFPDSVPDFITNSIEKLFTSIDDDNNDIADYRPNPFKGYNPDINYAAKLDGLFLVDGGLDGQNIPLNPVTQPIREVDVVFAVDSSADTTVNWPNGTALRATYDRSTSKMANGTDFPAVPDDNTFINLGLNKRPSFFGCDAKNFSDSEHPPPLIVYVPNSPYTYFSNVSTFDPSYEIEERDGIILNGFNGATQGNGTIDENWPTCVACAALERSFHRTGADVPKACKDCFDKYCWDGTIDDSDPGDYLPALQLEDNDDDSAGVSLGAGGASWALVAGAAWALVAM